MIHYEGNGVTLHHGDCLDVLRTLPDASVDSVCTDPPYGLEFMGKDWDSFKRRESFETGTKFVAHGRTAPGGFDNRPRFTGMAGPTLHAFQSWCEQWAAECLRVLKPGGHLLAFGGTRTWHRLACAVEDAGFEVRDSLAWLYGSGFPKSLDVSKAIDKAAGAEREVVGRYQPPNGATWNLANDTAESGYKVGLSLRSASMDVTAPATDAACEWEGWGTALKPAFEPVVVARKPLTGTVAANVQQWGTGALNIDASRIEHGGNIANADGGGQGAGYEAHNKPTRIYGNGLGGVVAEPHSSGRWPANVILDEDMAGVLDQQSGTLTSGAWRGVVNKGRSGQSSKGDEPERPRADREPDKGGASRFFYVAKAPKRERPVVDGVAHPTVKPLALMRWLVRLVTPPGGTVLEPFAGSGTTVEACLIEGFACIAIEKGDEYLPLILARIERQGRERIEAEVVREPDPVRAIVEQVDRTIPDLFTFEEPA